MKKPLLILSFILSIIAMGFAQSPKDVRMFLDYARFRYDDNNTYLEIYYLLYDLNRAESSVDKTVLLEFSLSDVAKDSVLAKSDLHVTLDRSVLNSANSTATKGSLIKTVLPAGRYQIKMVRVNQSSTIRMDSLTHEFSTGEFTQTAKIAVSDLELCSAIKTASSNKSGLFYKNTMEVFPNPMRMYNVETPKLYYYLEMYNLKSENPEELVDVEVAIANTNGEVLANKHYRKKRTLETSVEVGSFNVGEYKNGLYTLIFAALDRTGDYSVYTRSNFYIMKPGASEQEMLALFPQSEFAAMSEPELDEAFEQAQYVATKSEIQIYKNLDTIESKRMYLFRFWLEREEDNPGLRNEYYARVQYANENFTFSNRKGWQTDRGRVYIKYGGPNQTERRPSTREFRPFVLWIYYEMEGGARFVFVDESGFGDYKLKSSSLRGELYDETWDDLLLRGEFVGN